MESVESDADDLHDVGWCSTVVVRAVLRRSVL